MSGRVAAVVEQSWHRVPGGTAIATVRTLEALVRRGDWEVVGVAAAHRSPPSPLAAPPVPVRHVPLGRRPLYAAWHGLRRPAVERWTGPVDVIHATGGAVPPARDAALVVTIHDLAFLHRPDHFTRRGVAFLTNGLELTRRHATRVIVPSQATADDCAVHGIDRERVDVVPWGVDPPVPDRTDRAAVRARYDLPDRFVLWVGTAEPRKNLARLVAAMERVADPLPLVLVGPGGWGVDLSGLLAAAEGRVRHLGQVPGADLGALYDAADVFAYPSLMEGFGMPVLEAMAHGTPVLTSAGTSTEEVAGGAAVLVDPHDVEAMAAALDRLVGDAALRRRLAEEGRARAATMTWDRTAAATAAVYARVVAG